MAATDQDSVTIDVEECVGCGACIDACPNEVLDMVDEHAAVVQADECVQCGICVDECPSDAITL